MAPGTVDNYRREPHSLWRKEPGLKKEFAQVNAVRGVDVQDGDGRSTARRQPNEPRTVPCKVPFPALPPGIEQHNDPPGHRVAPAQVAPFGEIAMETGPSEEPRIVDAAVFLRQNMLEVKREERQVIFMKAAIFATPFRAGSD
jgi:hypothetical protein